jgi:hypothetical protein
MIRHLGHGDIDKVWWDARIVGSSAPLWYARSAVLDAASPGWEALVDDSNNAVMPLTVNSKWGISYLYQPFAVQRLGVFAPLHDPVQVGAFLSAIPRHFRLWDICLHTVGCEGAPLDVVLRERTNMELQIGPDAARIRDAYGESHRRGLRKWADEGEVLPVDGAAFLTFVTGSSQFKQWGIKRAQIATLVRLATTAEALGDAQLLGLRRGSEWLAMGLFVTWAGRTIFLKGLSAPEGRGVFALHRVMDAAIGNAIGRSVTFDMAGGDAPDLRRFYAGFGATPGLYLHAGLDRTPPLVRWIKQRHDGV